MSFSADIKSELIAKNIKKPCCKLAALSAFIRTGGSVLVKSGKVGFTLTCDESEADFFKGIIEKLYKEKAKRKVDKSGRVKLTVLSAKSLQILVDAKIVAVDEDGLEVLLDIDEGLIEKDHCAVAFIIGAFLGSGSVTIPEIKAEKSTGYHMEFVFSKYVTAADFAELLSRKGFMPKTVERKDNFVVYFKNAEEISDILALMGAMNAYLYLTDVVIKKEVRNEENRRINCELSNMTKQIDASLRLQGEIALIEESIGLDALDDNLKSACEARLNNPDVSLKELAEILGVTKSCLNHRLRKISEIAKNL